ncbi:MAG TPA: FmdB family zinc ribbon protein [Candidatus Angelobacter sp.]|nr:FmdB family zinc ribbon protein [Candidatus Angelobacter sp.]
MPTYDYQCRACGAITEVIHSMLDDGPSVCEQCGGELRRVLYPTGIIFKGSGFYKTDSRASSGGSGSTSTSTPAPAPGSTDGSASAAPSATPPASASETASGTKSATTKDAASS